jgi:hypothetical protein
VPLSKGIPTIATSTPSRSRLAGRRIKEVIPWKGSRLDPKAGLGFFEFMIFFLT